MAKFDNDFTIQNFRIEQLSNQKTSPSIGTKSKASETGCGSGSQQVPFSVGVGPSHRSRGVPYATYRGSTPFTTNYYSAAQICDPIIYFDFQDGTGTTVTNRGSTGSAADGTILNYGGGSVEAQWSDEDDIVISGTYSLELNPGAPPASTDESDGYIYIDPAWDGGFSPDFGGKIDPAGGLGAIANGDAWTVSIWWKCTRPELFNLWYVGLPGTTENTSVGLYVLANHSFVVDGNNSSHAANTLTGTAVADIRDGNAHHCVVTYNAQPYGDPPAVGSRANIYVDGNNITHKDTLNTGEYNVNNDTFVIGRGVHRNATDNHLSGVIGEFAYWDRVLSQWEIDQLYSDGDPSTRSNGFLDLVSFTIID